jgi:ArsR family transcriptional regulator, arsenate/arsenite/antimonite-responsive transcriptional repressor
MSGPSAADEETMRMLDAIGDPTRLQILFLLCSEGKRNVGDIAKRFRLTRPAISHHLRVLKDAKVVGCEKVGQEVYYWHERAKVVTVLRLLADAMEACCPPGDSCCSLAEACDLSTEARRAAGGVP